MNPSRDMDMSRTVADTAFPPGVCGLGFDLSDLEPGPRVRYTAPIGAL
jgi:hypothetical protein